MTTAAMMNKCDISKRVSSLLLLNKLKHQNETFSTHIVKKTSELIDFYVKSSNNYFNDKTNILAA